MGGSVRRDQGKVVSSRLAGKGENMYYVTRLDDDGPGELLATFENFDTALMEAERLGPEFYYGVEVQDAAGNFWLDPEKRWVSWEEYDAYYREVTQ